MSTQLFAEQYHLEFLSALGDNLEKLDQAVKCKFGLDEYSVKNEKYCRILSFSTLLFGKFKEHLRIKK